MPYMFGALSRQGKDVRLAVLVACSVERGVGQGAREPRNDRYEVAEKVSASEFATAAGTSAPRVLRHLTAWHKLSDAGLVPPAADLTPADAMQARGKVPIGTFSVTACGTENPNRVARHLQAWHRLAELGLVPPAADLTPADAAALDVPETAVERFADVSGEAYRPAGELSKRVRARVEAA
ncbi:hypothetical protein [Micropruina sp.]|uniref:hypothetical protein n=1 Tax=Micropruina sp. TaxID=2737536 RepID=UPI0039E47466